MRDDILGDAVVIAFRPGPPGQAELEQGMIALRAPRPKLLAELVDRVNQLQQASGELKELEPLKHQGATYYRRVDLRKTHYYYLHGPLLIVAGTEDMLRKALDRDRAPAGNRGPWPARFRRAGSEHALVTLGINPQALDPFPRPAKDEKPQGFAGFWRALDGVFITVTADTKLEVRLALQGRSAAMPPWRSAVHRNAALGPVAALPRAVDPDRRGPHRLWRWSRACLRRCRRPNAAR